MGQTKLEKMLFGYDAVTPSNRRRLPTQDLRSEDDVLRWHDRDNLVSTARDAARNYVLALWMIRKHLDFVADFSFEPNTPNDEFNDKCRTLMKRQSEDENAHVSKRHPLRRLLRMNEACRTMDGDVLWEKMKNGSINLIRGDRIRNPRGEPESNRWVNGVHINSRTKATIEYQIHTRTRWGGFKPEKRIPARNAILNGYFEAGDADQIRGVSPLASCLNNYRDTYEGIDFSLARLKIDALLGTAITKEAPQGHNPFAGNQQFETDDDATEEEITAAREKEEKSGRVKYGSGPWQIELEPGEDIKQFLSQNPSSQAQQFLNFCIAMALKALDIPYSFWSEDFTNFYGSRGALQHYKRSAQHKQADNQDVLNKLTRWWLTRWMISGELELPPGWNLRDVEFGWIPRGIPWWDTSKEIVGDMRAIGAGLDNPIDICQERGKPSPMENIRKTRKVLETAQKELGPFGYKLNFVPTETTLQQVEGALEDANTE